MIKAIPSLKAKAKWLPGALQCIKDNQGNYKNMESCILSLWRQTSQRKRPPSLKNALRAVFGPTLRHLQLIMGEGNSVKLTSKGKEILEHYDNKGELAFKKALAKHLLKLDKEHWGGIFIHLRKLNHNISISELFSNLEAKEYCLDEGKLRKFLAYFSYVEILKIQDEKLTIRKKQLEVLEKDLKINISDKKFIQILNESYEKLRKSPADPYVPIPLLREEVCERTGMWQSDFYKLLVKIPKETSKYLIHLTQPMLRKLGGIKLAGKYLYYIAIYMK